MVGLSDDAYARLVRKAERTNARRDEIDRQAGFATPAGSGPLEYLRTAESAIEAGLKMQDWDCVAEGLVMLRDALQRYHVIRLDAKSDDRREQWN